MSTIGEITQYLEQIAPLSYQEKYDNSGLIVGNSKDDVKGIIISLDCTEKVVEEAIEKGCNMVVSHHPIVFSGLKKIRGKNYIERVVIKAIQNNINIYAIHTNLDNVHNGVNYKIANKLGLISTKVLSPKDNVLKKLAVFVPKTHQKEVMDAIFEAGAGHIGNYANCSFASEGTGTFLGNSDTNPTVGEKGKLHFENELKIEVIFPQYIQGKVIRNMINAHPYEEVAYDIYSIDNNHHNVGSGMIGELENSLSAVDFLNYLKEKMELQVIRHSQLLNKKIQKVAVCGGSGSFLLNNAISNQADIFITADYKYHQFFDAEDKIIIADIGHYESEKYTIDLLYDLLLNKFPEKLLTKTKVNTNPVEYYS